MQSTRRATPKGVGVLLIEVRILLAAGNARSALALLDAAASQLRDWEQGTLDDSQRQDAQVARALRAQALAMLGDCENALGLIGEQQAALLLNEQEIWQRAVVAMTQACKPASILSQSP